MTRTFAGVLRRASAAAAVLAALGPTAALGLPGVFAFDARVEARSTQTSVSAIEAPGPAAGDADRLPSSSLLESRLRAGGALTWHLGNAWLQQLQLSVQADLFSGPRSAEGVPSRLDADALFAADRSPWALEQHLVRRFAVEADGRWGRVAVGRQVSTWGLGLLAQSGDDEPYQFGLKRRGAVVDRAQIALLPAGLVGDGSALGFLPLALVFAADDVVDDDLASKRAGDSAQQLIAAALLRYPELEFGAYGVRRWQTDSQKLGLEATVGDVYARWKHAFGKTRVQVATEWLMIRGTTTWFRTATSPDELNVAQHGGLVRVRVERGAFGLQLDGGLASGDDSPFDDTISNFKMARDLRVGLVLFGEMWRRQSANIVANLADPRYSGGAPAGADRFASNGSATGARWLSATLRAKVDRVTFLTGVLAADAPVPLVDPHRTGLAGGALTGPRGGAASRDLGWELDAAVQYDQPLGAGLSLRARLDLGVAFPGMAFAAADGSPSAAAGAAVGQLALRGHW